MTNTGPDSAGIEEQRAARRAVEEMVHRETRAWNARDPEALVSLFHPDMVWPWPPSASAHDPLEWVLAQGRFDARRWMAGWQRLFDTHELIHNRRTIRKIVVSEQADGGFAVVDIDTLWRDRDGRDFRWKGRTCKVYTKLEDGWKMIAHHGVLDYGDAPLPWPGPTGLPDTTGS